ncbi:DNA replication licensing factor mcm3 [Grosmannia clavigera kw1407]|uniref:DNA replication licensing factor MCM3 n=1 Tax=Grosmannia clavigera (strain kw1407 / UAMH 11150) TaxID=655863 RepID=F0XF33_GROCL|nr:DNA replication licensing factor mcm3 [Grosmannia clavigera kw1407]EFX03920.1 DNA replication licensing factor mcm3 [Grosmannia clavigera kw1407]
MDSLLLRDDAARNRVRQAAEFLDPSDQNVRSYRPDIIVMLQKNQRRLVVNLDHVRDHNAEMAEGLLMQPFDFTLAFNHALKQIVKTVPQARAEQTDDEVPYYCAWAGSFGLHTCNPRTLSSQHLNQMVSIEGIVTRCSLIHPKVVKSVHHSEVEDKFYYREYRDQTMTNGVTTSSAYPQQDEKGNALVTEYGLSTYRDNQTVSIQEMPERAPAGQLPRGVDVMLDDDLVDRVKPGDRVQLVGIFRTLGNRNTNHNSALFKTMLLANNVVLLSSKAGGGVATVDITDTDLRNINKVAKKKNLFELLSQSLAPSIYGHDHIKKAVLLMLLGGVEKNLENGTHLRGDINILMVGDPSTAKSQMLRFVLNTAPLAIATTGRGSSGVGLTAAVTTDKETGERRLEAGAMDPHKNIALPDSLLSRFDLLFVVTDDIEDARDRHISEHVLRMHRYRQPGTEEGAPVRETGGQSLGVGMQSQSDAASQRPVDVYEKHNDMLHSGALAGAAAAGGRRGSERAASRKRELLSIPFLKKYIQYAKTRVRPVLTQEASDRISDIYVALRNDEMEGNQRRTSPMTVRTLETLIRLATAHAKSRLSNRIEERDAAAAEAILRFALFKEVVEDESRRKKRKTRPMEEDRSSSDEEEDEDENEDGDDGGDDADDRRRAGATASRSTRAAARSARGQEAVAAAAEEEEEDSEMRTAAATPLRRSGRSGATATTTSQSSVSFASSLPASRLVGSQTETSQARTDEEEEEEDELASGAAALRIGTSTAGTSVAGTPISAARLATFRRVLGQLQSTSLFENETADVDAIVTAVNGKVGSQGGAFSREEAVKALEKMDKDNQIMYPGGNVVYQI